MGAVHCGLVNLLIQHEEEILRFTCQKKTSSLMSPLFLPIALVAWGRFMISQSGEGQLLARYMKMKGVVAETMVTVTVELVTTVTVETMVTNMPVETMVAVAVATILTVIVGTMEAGNQGDQGGVHFA